MVDSHGQTPLELRTSARFQSHFMDFEGREEKELSSQGRDMSNQYHLKPQFDIVIQALDDAHQATIGKACHRFMLKNLSYFQQSLDQQTEVLKQAARKTDDISLKDEFVTAIEVCSLKSESLLQSFQENWLAYFQILICARYVPVDHCQHTME